MITVITEYVTLLNAKARMAPARQSIQFRPASLIEPAQHILDATNRALGEARDVLNTAIDGLAGLVDYPEKIAHKMHARHAFEAIDTHVATLVDIDAMLQAAATLPADVDVDDRVADLRAAREMTLGDFTRNLLVLLEALTAARVEILPEDA
jgi:hypothetical protein